MGANGEANVNPSTGKGQGKAKSKAKPKGKANHKGNAKRVRSNRTTGRDCIQPGQPMGKLGSQIVKYQFQALVAK